ncbi:MULTISPECIES: anti-sigma factor domain-containing protein [Clostridium]|uniref:RsgI N-terminal anti-sigma domain-containing protein n=2 Tax=Clostridium TaxID=1485 RepID=A0A151APY8_9CLOT|nr:MULTISPECIES: anti-sigma factor domain-containing protein [Clostridium]KYH29652.1 hypothetical protein CLCOL_08830 [Clostridium colicanis DSM 13634]PRR72103.1 hypothetical protein CPAL_15900 [Clostridium thermopalmarium DSM 5974]PVZ23755.1 anti-sigma factor-like protein [Clostridium thermopalmarium DSM 5974]
MMLDKTGIVMEIKNKKARILTPSGEFVEVKINGSIPTIGSVYTGTQIRKIPFYKYAAAAACLIISISTGGAAYAYYTPTASITLNTDLELKLNRWNKIIKALPLNENGKELLSSMNLENRDVNDGLGLIMEKSEQNGLEISLDITSKEDKLVDLSKFKDSSKKKKLDVKINYNKSNSTTSAKSGIIKSDKKINGSNGKKEKNAWKASSNSNSLYNNKVKQKNQNSNNSSRKSKPDNSSRKSNNTWSIISNNKNIRKNLDKNSKYKLKNNSKNLQFNKNMKSKNTKNIFKLKNTNSKKKNTYNQKNSKVRYKSK